MRWCCVLNRRSGKDERPMFMRFTRKFKFQTSLARLFYVILAAALCGCVPIRGTGEKTLEDSFSVMIYNIWDLNGKRPAVEDVVEVIRSEGVPDLILLQEVRGEKMTFSLSEALGLRHCVYHGFNKRNFGVAIVSRYPLTESGFLDFKASRMNRGALKAVMMVKGRKVRVCSVHLDRVESIKVNKGGVEISWGNALNLLTREMSEETVRSRSVDELLAWMKCDGEGSVIIGGDFNTVLFSKAIRRMGTVYEDALWNMPDYLTGSYIKSTLPVDPRLDFLFYSKDLECLRGEVVRRTAGDHYPVRAEFVSPQRRRGR